MDRVEAKRMQVCEALEKENRKQLREQGGFLVAQVMTSRPSCISPDTTALELIGLFHTKQFRHLLVVDEEHRLIGIISDRDVLRCLGPAKRPDRAALAEITARDIMSTDLLTVTPGTLLERAVVLMIDQGVSCLPVLVGSTLVGIVTNTDLNVLLQMFLQSVPRLPSAQSFHAAPSLR
jgi:acetoin utilization protein AcuB